MKFIFLCCEHSVSEFIEICKNDNIPYLNVGTYDISKENIVDDITDFVSNEHTAILYSDNGMNKQAETFYLSLQDTLKDKSVSFVPMGSNALLIGKSNINGEYIDIINQYIIYGGSVNISNCFGFIKNKIFGQNIEIILPKTVEFSGIYDIKKEKVYQKLEDYLNDQDRKFSNYIGLSVHRSSWQSGDFATEIALTEECEKNDIGLIYTFSYAPEKGIECLSFEEVMRDYYSLDGRLFIDVLINLQMFLIKADDGESLNETASKIFGKLGIPVISPIVSYSLSEEKWKQSINPMAMDFGHTVTNGEMCGMIENVFIGSKSSRKHLPINERIEYLVARLKNYIALRHTENKDKKITLMLHNSVCSGVEATIGKAFGLDSFSSVLNILNRLKFEGYNVENIPNTAQDLLDLFLNKKAISDFRWTSVEDIVASGGCIYKMSTKNEYMKYFEKLPKSTQENMIETWGKAPGEGMVLGDDIIITGLNFGNINVMLQPKRGCYGAKCTGEVCKILHDPNCPVPHQYLATYRYIEFVQKANAVIHVGTEGSLEYLPGKSNFLSDECLPNAVLGSLVNLYMYHAGVPAEGNIAKRRTNALMHSYLPTSSTGINPEMRDLVDLIDLYFKTKDTNISAVDEYKSKIIKAFEKYPDLKNKFDDNFEQNLVELRNFAFISSQSSKISSKHVYGNIPSNEEIVNFISEIFMCDGLIEKGNLNDYDYEVLTKEIVENILFADYKGQYEHLSKDAKSIYKNLQKTNLEIDNLILTLNCKYLEPSESGMPDENGRNIIPTGRNMYHVSTDKIPSQYAYERGKILAEQLIEQYKKDEGKIPEKIALNMISVDITRTNGEQLSQILYLLGVRPVWDNVNRVKGLEPISIEELGRPRIDVVVRISGVLRDAWPKVVSLMDEAVMLVAGLDESFEENYIRKNTNNFDDIKDNRENTIRIFGDPPGSYGAGVDLAIKASAWKDEKDLARYFVDSSAYAYGKDLSGDKKIKAFIENSKQIDLSTDTISSRRLDTLSCGFAMSVQGGYKVLTKLLTKKDIRQYQSKNEKSKELSTQDLASQLKEDIETTVLNPFWRNNKLNDGYDGASEIMHRIQNIFEVQCTMDYIENETLDKLVEKYINNDIIREKMLEQNKFAVEEISRRFLELESRGKWYANEETLDNLRNNYLNIEGNLEENLNGLGEIQAGSVEIIDDSKVDTWHDNLSEVDNFLKDYN